MAAKKVKRDLWETVFNYPSFNIRFWISLVFILIIFSGVVYCVLFELQVIKGISDQIAALNLIVQFATLVLGIFAAYYALRQLVETRFISLDEAGMRELKGSHYLRAFEKWREAFYIRPEASVFSNMLESLLLVGDYNTFDQYAKIPQRTGLLGNKLFEESSDQIALGYLRAMRHLLVKNQGESEKHIADLIKLVRSETLLGFQWNFLDLRASSNYQHLNGECKTIAENLMEYLSESLPPIRKVDFESGNYASTV